MEEPQHQQVGQDTINNGLITITDDQKLQSGLTIQDQNHLNFTNADQTYQDDMDMSLSRSNKQIFTDGGTNYPKKRSPGLETRSQLTNHTTNKAQSVTD